MTAPPAAQLLAQLRPAVYYHLDNDLPENALFVAARLHAHDPRHPDSAHLLALCHQRLGQIRLAYDTSAPVARRGNHLGCAYVFAQACLKLERFDEGIEILEKARPLWEARIDWARQHESQRFWPDTPAALNLLGKLNAGFQRPDRAAECFTAALRYNPFMWDAFGTLCDTGMSVRDCPDSGADVRPQSIFKLSRDVARLLVAADKDTVSEKAPAFKFARPPTPLDHDPFMIRNAQSTAAPSLETPPAGHERRLDSRPLNGTEPPNAPIRKSRVVQPSIEINTDTTKSRALSTRNKGQASSEDPEADLESAPVQNKRTVSGQMSSAADATGPNNARRSHRLFSQIRPNSIKAPSMIAGKELDEPKKVKATGTRGRSAAVSTVGRVVSGNRKPPIFETRPPSQDDRPQVDRMEKAVVTSPQPRQIDSLHWLLDIFGKIGQGYHHLSRYECQTALKVFASLPAAQRDSPLVLQYIGRAHHEQSNYTEAEKVFSRLRKVSPANARGMEVYSTVLWHMKSDIELAFLAHEMVDMDRQSPEAWCTIGNSFSLQREHAQALKCFKRATQLNPKFAYGHTLQGHEYVANEEYHPALSAYRRAIKADARHYNGWYGLGKVYEKLGDHVMAEKHYRAAASINPTNAVLYCCIGVVLEKLKRPEEALEQYNVASVIQPSATNALYRKARVLLLLRYHDECLVVLNNLKDVAPDESNVHYMLGRVNARLHNRAQAIKHFTIAMNLDPKAAPYLKEQMEALYDGDLDETDEDPGSGGSGDDDAAGTDEDEEMA